MTEPSATEPLKSPASGKEEPQTDLVKEPPSRAKRIYGYTCNLLATGLVLIAAFTFGRQVLSWWQVDELRPGPANQSWAGFGSAGIATADSPLDLEIGDWPAILTREEFTGTTQAAQKELRHLCQRGLPQASFPTQPASPAELKMLASLEGQKPIATLPTGWKLYEQSGPVPLIAAVGIPPAGSRRSAGPWKSGISPRPEVADAARRVVSWGLGVHLTGTRWTLLLLTAQASSHKPDPAWPSSPLPPDAKRVLSLASARRESIVSFVGGGPREAWQTFYDQHFSQSATAQNATWRPLGNVWRQRYETPTAWIEIQLGTSPRSDQIQGLLTVRAKPTNDQNSIRTSSQNQ